LTVTSYNLYLFPIYFRQFYSPKPGPQSMDVSVYTRKSKTTHSTSQRCHIEL